MRRRLAGPAHPWPGSFPDGERMRGAGAHKFFSDREEIGVRGLGCAIGVRGCAEEGDGRD